MKVGIFDPYLDSLSGGEKYILTAASCLSDKNDVSIFWDKPQILKRAEEKFNLNLAKVSLYENIFASDVSLVNRLRKSKNFDLIIYLSNGSIPFVSAKQLFIHFQFPVKESLALKIRNRIKIKRTTKVFCNSFFTKKYIDQEFGIKSEVIYPPASEGELEHLKNKKENIILSVGRFELLSSQRTFKKHEVLINAFKKLVNSGLKNWELTLVISFPLANRLEAKFLEDLANGYPIKIIYDLNSGQLTKLYEKAKIYWHAAGFQEDLDKNPQLAEHFGISTVQAMEYGDVPVVINAGGQKEIVEDNKNGFLWKTEEELMDKTIKIINDEKEWEKLSLEAILTSKKFSYNEFCAKLHLLLGNDL